MIKIIINKRTPSINHLYHQHGFRKFLSKEAKELRNYIESKVSEQVSKKDIKEYKDKELKVVLEIYENWYTKKGTVYRKDLGNKEKFIIDSVFNKLEIDDKFIFNMTMIKVDSKQDKTILTIVPI